MQRHCAPTPNSQRTSTRGRLTPPTSHSTPPIRMLFHERPPLPLPTRQWTISALPPLTTHTAAHTRPTPLASSSPHLVSPHQHTRRAQPTDTAKEAASHRSQTLASRTQTISLVDPTFGSLRFLFGAASTGALLRMCSLNSARVITASPSPTVASSSRASWASSPRVAATSLTQSVPLLSLSS